MEGAAIAQVSSLNNVPFTVIRLISDLPSGKGLMIIINLKKKLQQCLLLP